jgi:hypothetical protein
MNCFVCSLGTGVPPSPNFLLSGPIKQHSPVGHPTECGSPPHVSSSLQQVLEVGQMTPLIPQGYSVLGPVAGTRFPGVLHEVSRRMVHSFFIFYSPRLRSNWRNSRRNYDRIRDHIEKFGVGSGWISENP